MPAHRSIAGLVVVAALGLLAPGAAAGARPARMTVPAMTAKVSAELGKFTTGSELVYFDEFNAVYDDPAPSLAQTLEFLASKGPTEDQKVIAVYAMQKLPFDGYLTFVNGLLALMNDGKVSARVFENGAFPTNDWNTLLAENHKHPKVRAFLAAARKSPKTKALRPYIDAILSGEAAKGVSELRDAGEIPK